MAVTKLIKKAAKNKSRAKKRVRTIRQSLTRNLQASPYKEESGVIIGTVDDVIEGKISTPVNEKNAQATEASEDSAADQNESDKVEASEEDASEKPE